MRGGSNPSSNRKEAEHTKMFGFFSVLRDIIIYVKVGYENEI